MPSPRPSLMVAISLSALAALPAAAHHSVRDVFDADLPIRIDGTVTATEWVNPHMLFRIEVGDRITVEGWPALDDPNR